MKWSLEDANDLSRWDERITVLNQHSYFQNIAFNEAWGEETIKKLRFIEEYKKRGIVHIRV